MNTYKKMDTATSCSPQASRGTPACLGHVLHGADCLVYTTYIHHGQLCSTQGRLCLHSVQLVHHWHNYSTARQAACSTGLTQCQFHLRQGHQPGACWMRLSNSCAQSMVHKSKQPQRELPHQCATSLYTQADLPGVAGRQLQQLQPLPGPPGHPGHTPPHAPGRAVHEPLVSTQLIVHKT